MKNELARYSAAALTLMGSLLVAPAAQAQWNATGIGVAEYDTKQTLLLLAGVSASPKTSSSIAPIIGVQGYHLGYDGGAGSRTNVLTVQPYVGLSDAIEGGSLNATIGYAFSNTENNVPRPAVTSSSSGKGVVLSGGYDYWGTGGPLGYQALASYNFGSESFWGRGRMTTRVSQGSNGDQNRVGAEVAYLTGKGYSAIQPGALYEIHTGGMIFGLGAGAKFFGNGGGSAAYFKAETVLPLFR